MSGIAPPMSSFAADAEANYRLSVAHYLAALRIVPQPLLPSARARLRDAYSRLGREYMQSSRYTKARHVAVCMRCGAHAHAHAHAMRMHMRCTCTCDAHAHAHAHAMHMHMRCACTCDAHAHAMRMHVHMHMYMHMRCTCTCTCMQSSRHARARPHTAPLVLLAGTFACILHTRCLHP